MQPHNPFRHRDGVAMMAGRINEQPRTGLTGSMIDRLLNEAYDRGAADALREQEAELPEIRADAYEAGVRECCEHISRGLRVPTELVEDLLDVPKAKRQGRQFELGIERIRDSLREARAWAEVRPEGR